MCMRVCVHACALTLKNVNYQHLLSTTGPRAVLRALNTLSHLTWIKQNQKLSTGVAG